MPVRIIGMIGVTPPSSDATLHVIEGGLSPNYLTSFARAHDEAGFDLALVGYSSSSAEGFLVALYAAMQTQRLGFLVAHRPGFVAPTLMARKIATFDHLTGGRLAVHIITGKTDDEQHGDGDFTPKAERYRRATEYLELMQLAWSNERPFDFTGEFYSVQGRAARMCARCKSRILCFSSAAPRTARSPWAPSAATSMPSTPSRSPPPASASQRSVAQAAAFGRKPGFNVSLRPIIAATEGAAWDKANRILAAMTGKEGLEPAGRSDRAGRQCRQAADELCAGSRCP